MSKLTNPNTKHSLRAGTKPAAKRVRARQYAPVLPSTLKPTKVSVTAIERAVLAVVGQS